MHEKSLKKNGASRYTKCMIRMAHISDLHFSKFSLNPSQLLSKEWLGNMNLLFNRSNHYANSRPFSLLQTFLERRITHVLISGDLTTTASHREYAMAKAFTRSLELQGMKVIAIPGNHDHYTKAAEREKRFSTYFPSPSDSPFNLQQHGVSLFSLCPGWQLILLDTTYASSLFSSTGLFTKRVEKHLKEALQMIPNGDRVILMNHFPFIHHDTQRRRLIRGEALQKLATQSALYLYGHTHRYTIADLRLNGLPLLLNCGSTGHQRGSWSQLSLERNQLTVTPFHWEASWQKGGEERFYFPDEERAEPLKLEKQRGEVNRERMSRGHAHLKIHPSPSRAPLNASVTA